MRIEQFSTGQAIQRTIDRVALTLQATLERLRQILFVFNNQNAHRLPTFRLLLQNTAMAIS